MMMPESQSLRLLAVHAHPDDESSKGAATLAHYAAAGVRVLAWSQIAAQILGIEHRWLGFIDSGFPEADENGTVPRSLLTPSLQLQSRFLVRPWSRSCVIFARM